jgi:hypothetical protein
MISRTYSSPTPGVWEVTVEASPGSSTSPAAFIIGGSLLGASVAPAAWVIDPTPVGGTVTQALTFTNGFGRFAGGATGTTLGSAFTTRATIAQGAQQVYTVNVEPLSTSFKATIGNLSDPRAELDLVVLDPAGNWVAPSISNPAPGTYTVVVQAHWVPSGSTQYDYMDYFENTSYGSVSVSDAPASHPFQDVWMGRASVTPMVAPAPGRFLRGHVQVKSGSVVIGSAAVDLRNVR